MHRDDAVRCVQCALDQMEVLGRFNRERIAERQAGRSRSGIGIHTGPRVVGLRRELEGALATRSSATRRTPARASARAPPSGQIVISEATLSKLGDRFEFEEIEPRSLKGKEKPMRSFNVLREKLSAVARAGGLG